MNEDLALYTTDELINELISRTTFQGLIVRSSGDYRGPEWQQGQYSFKVFWNANLSPEEVACVIDVVREALHSSNEQEEPEQGEE